MASRSASWRPVLAIITLVLSALAGAQEPEPRTIAVVARRFVFEPAEITVAVGERVRLLVTSGDGVHGIEIKRLNVKKEIPRGTKAVPIEFTATDAGRFPILCSEYCGKDHETMTGMLIVEVK